ncbi:MAG: hypothetical protein AAFN74_23415, partial [Myxococcota bacterium]
MTLMGPIIGGAAFGALWIQRGLHGDKSHRFLRCFLACLAACLIAEWSAHLDISSPWPAVRQICSPLNFCFGPFLYLWQRERRLGPVTLAKSAPHALPFLIVFITTLISHDAAGLRRHETRLQIVHIGLYVVGASWIWVGKWPARSDLAAPRKHWELMLLYAVGGSLIL